MHRVEGSDSITCPQVRTNLWPGFLWDQVLSMKLLDVVDKGFIGDRLVAWALRTMLRPSDRLTSLLRDEVQRINLASPFIGVYVSGNQNTFDAVTQCVERTTKATRAHGVFLSTSSMAAKTKFTATNFTTAFAARTLGEPTVDIDHIGLQYSHPDIVTDQSGTETEVK